MSAPPRLLVIGANGFIGAHLVHAAAGRFACTTAARTKCDVLVDIGDPASVAAAFGTSRPHTVVLLAAMADVDRCQREPGAARETNVAGAWNVARECARSGARLLFASSGAVFDGTCPEYREDSPRTPVSVYGQTKAEAEDLIAGVLQDAIIVRLSLVLGYPLGAGTNALVDKLQSAFQEGRQTSAPADEYRNAIDVETVTRWILDLAADPRARGVFHLGSKDALSRYEIVQGLAQAMGYPAALVTPVAGPQPDRAPRGRYELLTPGRIGEFSATPVPSCRQAIERCVHAVA